MTHLSLGDLKVAERLLQARANPEAVPTKDTEGKTPLLWACKEGDADATLLLLKYKADIEATSQDGHGYTPLKWAIWTWNADIVRLVVKHGASLEKKDEVHIQAHALANTCCMKDVR
jgi:ankyrin repeat protein